MTTIGVATLVSGRRKHLANLLLGLARQVKPADHIVVARMDDEPIDVEGAAHDIDIIDAARAGSELPLAAARNAAIEKLGTDFVVLLDVDCIPGSTLVADYHRLLDLLPRNSLLSGDLRYLPPGLPASREFSDATLRAASVSHPARPSVAPGRLLRQDDFRLAWTTSLAFSSQLFSTLDGFDERFVGYGAEDTDFAERARLAGAGMWWTSDAVAFHQHHDPAGPPRQHVAAIVRNAILFHDIHGWWPMTGWLETFAAERLIAFSEERNTLRLLV